MDAQPLDRGAAPVAPVRKVRTAWPILLTLLPLAAMAAVGSLSFPAHHALAEDRIPGATPAPAGPSSAPASRPAESSRPKVKLLYVDGYPRWEYRYLSRAMIRDKSIDVSCLLTSAAEGVAQEGDPADPRTGFPGRISEFPETIDQLLKYDVVLFGDVDPRELTDRQIKLIAEFVTVHGGGFGMIAGPRFAPVAYRDSPLAAVLPVDISQAKSDDAAEADGFRPVLTTAGLASPIFRGLRDPDPQRSGLRQELQPLYWSCRGVTAKADRASVLAVHPIDKGPDGTGAPLVVVGTAGLGYTMFAGIDDTWRWRFYTGVSLFETYWEEQVRALAAGRVSKADDAGTSPAGAPATRPVIRPDQGKAG